MFDDENYKPQKFSKEERDKILSDGKLRYKLMNGKMYFKDHKNEWNELPKSYR